MQILCGCNQFKLIHIQCALFLLCRQALTTSIVVSTAGIILLQQLLRQLLFLQSPAVFTSEITVAYINYFGSFNCYYSYLLRF